MFENLINQLLIKLYEYEIENLYLPLLTIIALIAGSFVVTAQNVGIGTNSPNSKAILDLTASDKVFLPPRLTTAQMNAITTPPQGSIIYNTDLQQYMGYVLSHVTRLTVNGNQINVINNRWQPISTGPRMLAWGLVDSFGTVRNGSGNFSITWDGYSVTPPPITTNWYRLALTGTNFRRDSMMLIITAIGNGSWDQTISIGELTEGQTTLASIKFTDVSRAILGYGEIDRRRRSWFYFCLYDLRANPF